MKDYHEPNPLIAFVKARIQGASVAEAMQVMSDRCDSQASLMHSSLTHEKLRAEVRQVISISLRHGDSVEKLRNMSREDRVLALSALLSPEYHRLLETEESLELLLSLFAESVERAEDAIRAMEG